MGKTRDLFKKIGNTKGTFHAKMGTIKDETIWTYQKQKILRRGGKNTQKNSKKKKKKGVNDPNNHDGVVTHPEPDILECEVKWALGSITANKASGGDGIALFQILKDDAVEVLHSIYQHIWKTEQWSQDWKRLVFIPIPKERQCPRIFQL